MKLKLLHNSRYDILVAGRVYERSRFDKPTLTFAHGSKQFTVDEVERVAEWRQQRFAEPRACWHSIDDAVLGRAA